MSKIVWEKKLEPVVTTSRFFVALGNLGLSVIAVVAAVDGIAKMRESRRPESRQDEDVV